jgi:UDP-GlcNAc:undecaprenyl-phosphate GlcNAc-1-phosphate transferase
VAVLSRIRRHISPFQGGQDHLSHRLIRAGYTRRTVAFHLWGLSALFATVAISISRAAGSEEIYTLIAAGLLWIVIFVLFFKTKDT